MEVRCGGVHEADRAVRVDDDIAVRVSHVVGGWQSRQWVDHLGVSQRARDGGVAEVLDHGCRPGLVAPGEGPGDAVGPGVCSQTTDAVAARINCELDDSRLTRLLGCVQ